MFARDAAELYTRRWGTEVLYRSLKQTMGRRRACLCGNPAHAAAELGLGGRRTVGAGIMAADAVAAAGHAPARLTLAAALSACAASDPQHRAARGGAAPTLAQALAGAVRDDCQRTRPKAARTPVNKKRDRPPGMPLARTAADAEITRARTLKELNVGA
jgi:hypothetical protein